MDINPPSPAAVAPDARGENLYRTDASLGLLLDLRLAPGLRARLEPHLVRLGAALGGPLDEAARLADRHPPVLHPRDRFGEDRPSIEYHPAYRALEEAAFGACGLAAMSHRSGVFGEDAPLPAVAKYALTYMFAQSEFGLLCPVNMTDSLTRVLRRHAAPDLLARYLPGLTALDAGTALQGAMFMTEKAGGSDVGANETRACPDGGAWRLFGEKWFCSNADADLALVLARPEGALPGTRGLGLFLMPRVLPDGSLNRYRIVRLKDKLGSRSMASGEAVLDGALAWVVGRLDRGFVQMAEMVNASRLSNAVRAAGLMRRAFLEALLVCRGRSAFGGRLVDLPLQRRQLLKILLPGEQALSVALYAAEVMQAAEGGDAEAEALLRLLTPLLKFRACRDARRATGDAMEVRGGCGYVEEFVEPRLLRDAHLGSIWEGTSNIVAIDAVKRAVGRQGGGEALAQALGRALAACEGLPAAHRARLRTSLDAALELAREVAREDDETGMRQAASALYHATSAVLLSAEAQALGPRGAPRALLAGLVLAHRLQPRDPLRRPDPALERAAAAAWLDGTGCAPESLRQVLV